MGVFQIELLEWFFCGFPESCSRAEAVWNQRQQFTQRQNLVILSMLISWNVQQNSLSNVTSLVVFHYPHFFPFFSDRIFSFMDCNIFVLSAFFQTGCGGFSVKTGLHKRSILYCICFERRLKRIHSAYEWSLRDHWSS